MVPVLHFRQRGYLSFFIQYACLSLICILSYAESSMKQNRKQGRQEEKTKLQFVGIPSVNATRQSISRDIRSFINNVIAGDCLDILPHIPDGSLDMILCNLPFGTTQNTWDSPIDIHKLWQHYERIIKPNGAIVPNAHGLFTARLIMSNEKLFKYKICWIKSKATNFLNAKKQPLRKHEDICVFYKKQPLYNPQLSNGTPYTKGVRKAQETGSYGAFKPVLVESSTGTRLPTDVIYFRTAESEGTVWHPTQKPVSLGQYLIKTFTNPGALILDNACGSGSYLVAAVKEGRNFIGIEKNVLTESCKGEPIDYIKLCRERIMDAYRNKLHKNMKKYLHTVNLFAASSYQKRKAS